MPRIHEAESEDESLMTIVAELRAEAIRTWRENQRNKYRDVANQLEVALRAFQETFSVHWLRRMTGLHARAMHLLHDKEEVA